MPEVLCACGADNCPLFEREQNYVSNVLSDQELTFYIYGPSGMVAREVRTGITPPSSGPVSFYLKDHLGSTRMVLAQTTGFVEASYDYSPFGEVMRSTIITDSRYTYTGQESDGESGLMNYHARLYDPAVGRFGATDPAGQFNSPYAYVGNNPVSFTDPTGEIAFLAVVGIFAGINLTADFIRGDLNSFGDVLGSTLEGGLQGALATLGPAGGSAQAAFASAISSQLPAPTVTVGNTTIGVSPTFAYGTNGLSLGAGITGSVNVGSGVTIGAGFGGSITTEGPAGQSLFGFDVGTETRTFGFAGYQGDRFGISYSNTTYRGLEPNQRVGSLGLRYGSLSLRHDNDVSWLGGDGDRFRTAGLEFGVGQFVAGFQLYTGDPGPNYQSEKYEGGRAYSAPSADRYRQGLFYFGFGTRGGVYRIGADSEPARAFVQNTWHSFLSAIFPYTIPHFRPLARPVSRYAYYGSRSPFSIY